MISIDNPLTLEEKVIEMLKTIFDPEIPVNIYDLGLIYEIKVGEEKASVHIQMTLTSPMCPVAQTFPQTVQDEILKVAGVSNVTVELVWDPPWTKDRLSESTQLQLNLL
ncbi:MAG: SUF system Fe-S cluster assembly protein [Gammaproteobacteria bacterium]|nr:SUF system Fe-S cluster assembly protein [Gammaproteobacteria bacterium]MBP9728988.1 SUF system Fe-S cluster assembly protein [Gammaproteobacteria bacterium]